MFITTYTLFFLTLDRSACPQNARAPACAPERAPSVAAACPPPPRMPQHRYPSGSAEIRVCEHVCACGNGQALPALTQTARESPSSSMRPASNSTRPSVRTRGCWAALYRRKVSIGPVGADEYQSPGSPGTLTDERPGHPGRERHGSLSRATQFRHCVRAAHRSRWGRRVPRNKRVIVFTSWGWGCASPLHPPPSRALPPCWHARVRSGV